MSVVKKLNGQNYDLDEQKSYCAYIDELEHEVKKYKRLLRKREEKNRKLQNRYYFLLRKIVKGHAIATAEKILRHGKSKLN